MPHSPVGHYKITLKQLQILPSYFLTLNVSYSYIISHNSSQSVKSKRIQNSEKICPPLPNLCSDDALRNAFAFIYFSKLREL